MSPVQELRQATEEQLDRLELVAADLLAEIRLTRRMVRGRKRAGG